MLLKSGVHLGYCTNIHPGETWREVEQNLRRFVPAVSARVAPGVPFGIGLRLSAQAASELDDAGVLDEFAGLLVELNAYVFSINGFPYGRFHGAAVKEAVYLPDWRAPERFNYTTCLARILARLAARVPKAPKTLSISTVPGCFRSGAKEQARREVALALVRQAVELARLAQETGVEVVLALEPEPACLLETTAEAVQFLEDEVFTVEARYAAARAWGCVEPLEPILRRHLGLCLDTCHAAVQFETPEETLGVISRSAIKLAKVQITTALSLPVATKEAVHELRRFSDAIYLHQVSVKKPSGIEHLLDLPEALARPELLGFPWRVHFHVPIFQRTLGLFENTQPFLEAILAAHSRQSICEQFEVETYTFDVLPDEFRTLGVEDSICRELLWARARLDE